MQLIETLPKVDVEDMTDHDIENVLNFITAIQMVQAAKP